MDSFIFNKLDAPVNLADKKTDKFEAPPGRKYYSITS